MPIRKIYHSLFVIKGFFVILQHYMVWQWQFLYGMAMTTLYGTVMATLYGMAMAMATMIVWLWYGKGKGNGNSNIGDINGMAITTTIWEYQW